jgi:hypothetical protein
MTAADWRLIAAAIVIIAASSLFVWRNYRAAFPQASLDLRLTRDQITRRAEQFLRSERFSLDAYRNLTIFDPDDEVSLFLEYKFGRERANQLMNSEVNVWRWRARWYRPPEKEEVRVWLATGGRLIGFQHVVREDAAGARLPIEQARAVAEQFLRRHTNRDLRLVDQSSQTRPRRTDHEFTWERNGFRLDQATERWTVLIQGDRIGSYSEYLHLPDQWKREFQSMRSKNELLAMAANVCWLLLAIAAAVVAFGAVRQRAIPWRDLMPVAATVGVLQMFAQWNHLQLFLDSLPTSTPISQGTLMILLGGIGVGVSAYLMAMTAMAPGEVLYRQIEPSRLRLPFLFTRAGLQTLEVFRAAWVGWAMAAAHLAFLIAFYLLARRFGAWSPQDVEYSNLLSTYLPWLYPMTTSVQAASIEEFWFRLLAVLLLKRWTRSNWVAVLIPAFVWGFLHANYPQQPAWIRGVEVGLIGVAAGVVFLRFGILATLVWHYTVDAVLFSTFLFATGEWHLLLSGVAVSAAAAFPLAWCVWKYRVHGGFLDDPALLNESVPVTTKPASEETLDRLPPLPPAWRPRLLYVVAAALFLGGLLVRPSPYGDFLRIRLARSEAISIAGPAHDPERHVAEFIPNLDRTAFEYFRQTVGSHQARALVESFTLHGFWRLRYFRPLEKQERLVYVDSARQIRRIDWVLDEKAPGANLTRRQAIELAYAYLQTGQNLTRSILNLVDSSEQKRDARTDHHFEWEDNRFPPGEARARVSLDVLGDKPSGFRRYLKLPEKWLREQNKLRIASYLTPGLLGGLAITLLVAFLRTFPKAPIQWRPCILAMLASIALYALSVANQSPAFYQDYDTTQPLNDFWSGRALASVSWALLVAVLILAGSVALQVFLWLVQGLRAPVPVSTPTVLAILGLLWGMGRIWSAIDPWIPGARHRLPLWRPPDVEGFSPAIAAVTAAAANTIGAVIIAGIMASAAVVMLSPSRRRYYFAGAAALLALGNAASFPEWLAYFLAIVVLLALLTLMVLSCGAALRSFACAFLLYQLVRSASHLIQQPALVTDARIVFSVTALITLGIVALARRTRSLPG